MQVHHRYGRTVQTIKSHLKKSERLEELETEACRGPAQLWKYNNVSGKKKCVIVVSTKNEHKNDTVLPAQDHEPLMIDYYNANKGGVDCVNWLKESYTTARTSYHWPMAIFFNLLDITAINCHVLYRDHPDNQPRDELGASGSRHFHPFF